MLKMLRTSQVWIGAGRNGCRWRRYHHQVLGQNVPLVGSTACYLSVCPYPFATEVGGTLGDLFLNAAWIVSQKLQPMNL